MDHWGLIDELPAHWPVMTGERSAELMRLTSALFGGRINRPIACWTSRSGAFDCGPFRITPFLTDHSAVDAYMLLIECEGTRLLYTGDFRMHGRKSELVDRTTRKLANSIDIMVMEGTNLGANKPVISEAELERQFVDLAKATPGQLYVQWSAQNIDRTVTLYRAALRSGRELVVDLYAADVLARIAKGTAIPRPGSEFERLRVLVLSSGKRLFARAGRGEVADDMARQPYAISRRRLPGRPAIIMHRDSMLRDFDRGGMGFTPDDAYAFSNWSGYLDPADPQSGWNRAGAAGARTVHLTRVVMPAPPTSSALPLPSRHAGWSLLTGLAGMLLASLFRPSVGFRMESDGRSRLTKLQHRAATLSEGWTWFAGVRRCVAAKR